MAYESQIKHSEYTLTPTQMKELFKNAGSFRNRCILKLLAYCAFRRFEVAKLRIEDVDFERNRIRVIGKGDKEAVVPCPPMVVDDLNHLVGERKHGYVFESSRGGHISGRQINNITAKAGESAGIDNPNPKLKTVNPHLLRHSCARILKDAGANLETIQKVMRHASYKTTMDMYGTKSIDDVQEEFEEAMDW